MIRIQNSRSTDKAWNPVPRIQNPRRGIQNPRMSYSLTWGDLEATSKKTWQTGNNLLQNFGSERVKHFPQGYPQFITESLKEEQKEHS